MQTSKVSFAVRNILTVHRKTNRPVKVLYGLKPMEDTSVSKLTLGVNKSVKFFKNVMNSAVKMFK